jgi:endonuclease/exonuclease/phosphatase family metal-dependent hydrolase
MKRPWRPADDAAAAHLTGRPAHPAHPTLRVATYNIHKGVRGVGPRKRLEIHNLGLGIEALDADLVFLQEVRLFHKRHAQRFDRTSFGWPDQGQAEYLAPRATTWPTAPMPSRATASMAMRCCRAGRSATSATTTSATTASSSAACCTCRCGGTAQVHAVVAHLGLIHASRVRQVERLAAFIAARSAADALLVVAGDFNDWGEKLDEPDGRHRPAPRPRRWQGGQHLTFPSLMPVFALDRFYLRGLPAARPWCRAASPGRACPTTCRWWPSSSLD